MRIVNRTEAEASYELKGGPLRMTLSTCLLLPGEEEIWTSPYARHQVRVACEVHVTVADEVKVLEAEEDATVLIEASPEGFRLRLEA